jgi:hypothetical protein
MRVGITCPYCMSDVFQVALIDGERMVLHCYMCSRELHVKPEPVKLVVS